MRKPEKRIVVAGVATTVVSGVITMLLARRRSVALHPQPTPPRRRPF